MFEPHVYHDSDEWNVASGTEREGFIGVIGSTIDGSYNISPETTNIAWRSLSFYENAHLVRLIDKGWGNGDLQIFFVVKEGKVFRLSGQYEQLKEANEMAPLKLSEDNVLDYLKFYSFFARKDDMPYYIAEDISDPHIDVRSFDPVAAQKMENVIHPATYEGQDAGGNYVCSASVYFPTVILEASYTIAPQGSVKLTDSTCSANDIKIVITAPLGKEGADFVKKLSEQE